ncbi:MAG: CapA family protein [Alphaproteobacteria bacterium]
MNTRRNFYPTIFAAVWTILSVGLIPSDVSAQREEPVMQDCVPETATLPPAIRFDGGYDPDDVVTIAAVGDVLLHDVVQRQVARIGYEDLWAGVAPILRSATLTYANLEGSAAQGVLMNGRDAPPSADRYDNRIFTGYPQFNYHPDLISALVDLGVDVVSTANNHSLDRLALGVDRTIEALENAGLPYTGTRHRDRPGQAFHTLTTARSESGREYTIAWLACTYGTNDIPDPNDQVLFCFEHTDRVLPAIAELHHDPAIDAVILTPHWGTEYTHVPEERQTRLARAAIASGATAVIGAHPHVIQPGERYVSYDGREGFIFQSLGNFVSNQRSLARRTNLILTLALAPDPSGGGNRLRVVSQRHIPTRVDHYMGSDGATIGVRVMDGRDSDRPSRELYDRLLSPQDAIGPDQMDWYRRGCAP